MRTEQEILTAMSVEKAVSDGVIGGLEAQRKEHQEKYALYNKHVQTKERELDEYISTNPVAIQRRDLERRINSIDRVFMWSALAVAAEVILAIVCLFVGNWWLCLSPLILVVFAIINSRKKAILQKEVDILTEPLKEFDVYKKELEENCKHYQSLAESSKKDIDDCSEKIRKAKEGLATSEQKVQAELKYAHYAKNFLMVYVQEKRPDYLRQIPHEIVIDGVSYGCAMPPFKPIMLTPGLHTVRVFVKDLGDIYSSNVDQINFSGNSCFLYYEYTGSIHPFSGRLYGEVDDFFKATKQKP